MRKLAESQEDCSICSTPLVAASTEYFYHIGDILIHNDGAIKIKLKGGGLGA